MEFAVKWSTTDPIAASKWVETLPASDAKLWVEKTFATRWAQYDPKAADRWEKSLPEADRAALEKLK